MAWIKQRPSGDRFIPFTQTFNYTGNVQSLTIPSTGLYELKVYGGKGGGCTAYAYSDYGVGANGAYACGYKKFNRGDVVYIIVGNAGGYSTVSSPGAGGYNGGGAGGGRQDNSYVYSSSGAGGGATHISLEDKTIASTVDRNNILIVAGGGGGGGAWNSWDTHSHNDGSISPNSNGVYGNGSNCTLGGNNRGGGGGGYYGGTAGYSGVSFTDNVPAITYKGVTYSPSVTNGSNSGAGSAVITRIA